MHKKINNNEDNFERIGWFQIQLLLQLAFQPKYGFEIINDLKLNNINISTGQIYPALKKLVKSGHLETFSKRGRAARRKYYQITEKGLNDLRRLIRSILINLIPVMYSFLGDLKVRLFNNYKIDRGDTILLYSYPIKKALIDLAQLVGDSGKIYVIVDNELSKETLIELAIFNEFENVIKPIFMTKDLKLNYSEINVNKAILMLFQKEKDIDILLKEICNCIKPDGKIYLLSTKLNIFNETFLAHFDFFNFLEFFDGYTESELKEMCDKHNFNIERSEELKKITIIEAIKKNKSKKK